MELELRFFANFRAEVGQKILHREYDDGSTVGEILLALEAEFPGLEGDLIEDGAIRDQLSILKNGRDVVHMEGTETLMEDGDRLSVFPPVAGGASGEGDQREPSERRAGDAERRHASGEGDQREPSERVTIPGDFSDAEMTVTDGEGHVQKSFRGISERLAKEYLVGLGGEHEGDHAVVAGAWRAETAAESVPIYEGATMTLTEVTVTFTGDPDALVELVPAFSRKAVRAGG